MKKIICLWLLVSMLITVLPMGVSANTSPALLFEMDLSESTTENLVVKASSASTGTDSVSATYTKDGTEYSPDYKEEDGLKYLSFRSGKQDTANQASRVTVQLTDTGILNKNNLTFETWARSKDITNAGDNRFFGLGFEPQNKMGHYVRLDTATVVTIPDGAGAGSPYVSLGKIADTGWHHYAFVYNFTPHDPSAPMGAGKWSVTMYIDGVFQKTGTANATTRNNYLYGSAGGTNQAGADWIIYNDLIIGDSDGKAWVGDIATFKMYDGALTEAAVKKNYEDTVINFTPFAIKNVSVADGSVLPLGKGQIDITFSEAINPATAENIIFTTATGNDISGRVVKTVSEDGCTVSVKFGRLVEGGSYKLCVPSTVKSATGKSTDVLNYTYSAGVQEYLLNEEFKQGDAVTPIVAAGTTAISTTNEVVVYGDDKDSNGAVDQKITLESEDGDYFLRLDPSALTVSSNVHAVVKLPSAITDDRLADGTYQATGDGKVEELDGKIFVADVKVRTTGEGASAARTMGFSDGNHLAADYSSSNRNIIFETSGGTAATHGDKAFEKDDEGWHRLRHTVRETDSKDTYGRPKLDVSIYDVVDNKYMGANTTQVKYSNLMIGGVYGTTNTKAKLDISSVALYYRDVMDVLNVYDYNAGGNTIAIAMTDDVDPTSIGNITVTEKSSGKAVEVTSTYNTTYRELVFQFVDADITEGEEYIIDLSKLMTQGTFPVAHDLSASFVAPAKPVVPTLDVDYTGAGGVAITNLTSLQAATELNAAVAVSNVEDFNAPVAILAVYNGNALIDVDITREWTTTAGVYTTNIKVDGLTPGEITDAKVFVWDGLTSLRPLFDADECL